MSARTSMNKGNYMLKDLYEAKMSFLQHLAVFMEGFLIGNPSLSKMLPSDVFSFFDSVYLEMAASLKTLITTLRIKFAAWLPSKEAASNVDPLRILLAHSLAIEHDNAVDGPGGF
jgi:hypothetical protein